MATDGIYKRGANFWMDFIHRGVRVQRSTKTADRKMALRIAEKAKFDIDEAMLNPALALQKEELNFKEAVDKIMAEHYELKDRHKEARKQLEFWQSVVGPKTFLHHVDEDMIEDGKKLLRRQGLKEATINRYLAKLSRLFTWCMERRLIRSKPMTKGTTEDEGRITVMSDEQEKRVLEYLSQVPAPFPFAKHLRDLIVLYVDTGLRRCEALDLTYAYHIDLHTRVIKISSDITKTGKPRAVPLTERAWKVLERRQNVAERVDHEAGGRRYWGDDALSHPFPYNESTVTHAMSELRAGLGIQDRDWCIHMLRHTYCTRLLESGVDLPSIQKLAGHTDPKTTLRYTHVSSLLLRSSVDKLEARNKPTPQEAPQPSLRSVSDALPITCEGEGTGRNVGTLH